jgi:hypothetical protein
MSRTLECIKCKGVIEMDDSFQHTKDGIVYCSDRECTEGVATFNAHLEEDWFDEPEKVVAKIYFSSEDLDDMVQSFHKELKGNYPNKLWNTWTYDDPVTGRLIHVEMHLGQEE